MITGGNDGDQGLERRLDRLEEQLAETNRKLEHTRAGSGGVGCCGGVALIYIIYLLWQILEKLG